MKKLLTLGLVVTLVAVAAVAVVPTPRANAQSAGLVSSIINRMESNRRDLRSLRSGISMTKFDSRFKEEEKYSGQVIYMPGSGRDALVRVDWQSPRQETLSVVNGEYKLFRPRLNMVYQGSANSNRNKVSGVMGFGLNVSQQQLASAYEPPQYLGEETLWGGVRTSHLKLVPRGNARQKYIEIWVDGGGMPVQTKVVERNDDSTTVRLTNVQKNASINRDAFTLKLPSDIKIVRG